MLRVGLTGGFASGKSFVGQTLLNLGCHLLKADELGHAVLSPGGEAHQDVIDAFGWEIVQEDGSIDRRALARLVFDRPDLLERLNNLVHPHVIDREERWMHEVQARDPHGIAVVEAAILIETGSYRRFDRIILAFCRPEQQLERAMKRDQLSRDEVAQRLRRQMSLEEKRKYADFVVDTSGNKEQTVEQVRAVHAALRSLEL